MIYEKILNFNNIIQERLFYSFSGFLLFFSVDIFLFNEIFYTVFYLIFLIEFFEHSYFLPDKELKEQIIEPLSRNLEPLIYRMKELNVRYYQTIILSNISFFLFIFIKVVFLIKWKWYFFLYLVPKGMDMVGKLLLLDKVNEKRKEKKSYFQSFDELNDSERLDVFWPQKQIVEYIYIPYINSLYLFLIYLIIFKNMSF